MKKPKVPNAKLPDIGAETKTANEAAGDTAAEEQRATEEEAAALPPAERAARVIIGIFINF